jgi:hypothetical protein
MMYFENDANQVTLVRFQFCIENQNCETILNKIMCKLLKSTKKRVGAFVVSSFLPVGKNGDLQWTDQQGCVHPLAYATSGQHAQKTELQTSRVCRADLFVTWLDIISSLQNTVYWRSYKKPVKKVTSVI